jgi:hypothetical protein
MYEGTLDFWNYEKNNMQSVGLYTRVGKKELE